MSQEKKIFYYSLIFYSNEGALSEVIDKSLN